MQRPKRSNFYDLNLHKQFLQATFWVAFFVLSLSVVLYANDPSSEEIRSLWVVRYSMISPESIDHALETASSLGFNNVFLQVRGRGDAYYSSQIVPRGRFLTDPDFDSLSYAVEKGHALGLKVHAWLNMFLVWSSPDLPKDTTHLFLAHPDWLDESRDRKQNVEPNFVNGSGGTPRFISPAAKGVTDHFVTVLIEILDQYDVDGIHLDYVRLADLDYGYHSDSESQFVLKYGLRPDNIIKVGNRDEIVFLQSEWDRIRRESVTDFIRTYSEVVIANKPDCILSVAVKPNPSVAKNRYFQEWDLWLAEGLVDYVVPMNYATEMSEFQNHLSNIEVEVQRKYNRSIIMGLAVFNQSPESAAEKLKSLSSLNYAGYSVFSWNALQDSLESYSPFLDSMKSKR